MSSSSSTNSTQPAQPAAMAKRGKKNETLNGQLASRDALDTVRGALTEFAQPLAQLANTERVPGPEGSNAIADFGVVHLLIQEERRGEARAEPDVRAGGPVRQTRRSSRV